MSPNFNSPEQIQPPPPETKTEKPELLEKPPPKPEYNQEAFNNLTKQAETQIDNDQDRLQDDPNNVIMQTASSISLSQEKATRIFDSGGFRQRISRVKDKISNLARTTKDRLRSLTSSIRQSVKGGQLNQPVQLEDLKEVEDFRPKPREMRSDQKGFDPSLLIRRRVLFQGVEPKARKARLEEFKENLLSQKGGLLEIEDDIRKAIHENSNIGINEIKQLIEPKLKQNAINPEQRKKIDKILEKYQTAHQAVRDLREKFPENERLLDYLLHFTPSGKIEVVEGPMTLAFICHSQEDFARLYARGSSRGHLKKTMETPINEALHAAVGVGGFVTNTGISKPEIGTIIVSKKSQQEYPEEFGDIVKHEEQHYEHSLLFSYRPHFYRPVKMEGVKSLPPDQQLAKIKQFLRFERQFADDDDIHDEILAIFSGHLINQTVIGKMIANIILNYRDKFYNIKIDLAKENLQKEGIDEKTINDAIDEIFERESYRVIRRSFETLLLLQNNGFTKDEIIHLLQTEPLVKWPIAAKRMIEFREKNK
jgi:hypothetical protein